MIIGDWLYIYIYVCVYIYTYIHMYVYIYRYIFIYWLIILIVVAFPKSLPPIHTRAARTADRCALQLGALIGHGLQEVLPGRGLRLWIWAWLNLPPQNPIKSNKIPGMNSIWIAVLHQNCHFGEGGFNDLLWHSYDFLPCCAIWAVRWAQI